MTAISKSQFVPIADFTSLLKWRLKKSRYLKVSKKINNALTNKIRGFFDPSAKSSGFGGMGAKTKGSGFGGMLGKSLSMVTPDIKEEQEEIKSAQEEPKTPGLTSSTKKPRRELHRFSILETQAGIKKSAFNSKQLMEDDDDSSDFSVDD